MHENSQNNHDPHAEIVQFSFWKPEPLPPKDATILPIDLLSLGSLNTVVEKLLDVPKMSKVEPAPWDANLATNHLNLVWEVDEGVVLQVRSEQGPPKPGEVLTINAKSHTQQKTFYRLYVQIYEQFGATVLDEQSHQFYTPREFRTKLAG